MPNRHKWSAWSAGPPPWKDGSSQSTTRRSTYDSNFAVQYKPRGYFVCPDRSCGGWSYKDRGDTYCCRCGAAFSSKPYNSGGDDSGKYKIKAEELSKLEPDNPGRKILEDMVQRGAAVVDGDNDKEEDRHQILAKRVKLTTQELQKTQNQRNHHRGLVHAARLKLEKLEQQTADFETAWQEKLAEHNAAWKEYEEFNLEEDSKRVTVKPSQDGENVQTGTTHQMQSEIQRLAAMVQQLQLELATAKAGPSTQKEDEGKEAKRKKSRKLEDGMEVDVEEELNALLQAPKEESKAAAAAEAGESREQILAAAKAAADSAAALLAQSASG